jgi:prolyl-tRNA synthetase
MKDSYSLDSDWDGLDKQYCAHHKAYLIIFQRCDLPVVVVKSDTGIMGGKIAHEFMYLTQVGEDTLLICDNCGYSANKQIAHAKKTPIIDKSQIPIEKAATPNCKTIEELADYLSIPTHKTAKAFFIIATFLLDNIKTERFVIAIVRGDMEVSETKLVNTLNAIEIRPATEAEIRAIGAIPGYASPVGLTDVFTIVDDLIPLSPNLVSGANIEGYHLLNVNYERDYKANIISDITVAKEGDSCDECSQPLRSARGEEVGNIFKLGTRFSESMNCYYLDKQGQSHPIIMGSYGIGIGRLLACIAEEHHDEHGLIWPITVSPYEIHLVSLPWKTSTTSEVRPNIAEELYQKFNENQIECLFDDREESPGIKFNDADLIGNPIRLTVSERSIKNGGIEYKRRDLPEKMIIPYDNIIPAIQEEIKLLEYKIIRTT